MVGRFNRVEHTATSQLTAADGIKCRLNAFKCRRKQYGTSTYGKCKGVCPNAQTAYTPAAQQSTSGSESSSQKRRLFAVLLFGAHPNWPIILDDYRHHHHHHCTHSCQHGLCSRQQLHIFSRTLLMLFGAGCCAKQRSICQSMSLAPQSTVGVNTSDRAALRKTELQLQSAPTSLALVIWHKVPRSAHSSRTALRPRRKLCELCIMQINCNDRRPATGSVRTLCELGRRTCARVWHVDSCATQYAEMMRSR